MDAIMTKILEIERHSREIVQEAEERRDRIDGIIAEEKEKLRQSLIQREERSLVREREEILRKAQEDAKENMTRARSKMEAMERFEKTKREEWIQELYTRIVNG